MYRPALDAVVIVVARDAKMSMDEMKVSSSYMFCFCSLDILYIDFVSVDPGEPSRPHLPIPPYSK